MSSTSGWGGGGNSTSGWGGGSQAGGGGGGGPRGGRGGGGPRGGGGWDAGNRGGGGWGGRGGRGGRGGWGGGYGEPVGRGFGPPRWRRPMMQMPPGYPDRRRWGGPNYGGSGGCSCCLGMMTLLLAPLALAFLLLKQKRLIGINVR